MDMGGGVAKIDLHAPEELYDRVIEELIGERVTGKDHFHSLIKDYKVQVEFTESSLFQRAALFYSYS